MLLLFACIILQQFTDPKQSGPSQNFIDIAFLIGISCLGVMNLGYMVYLIVLGCKEKLRKRKLL